jgi:RNA polymerase sigma factor (sigma-70 family)
MVARREPTNGYGDLIEEWKVDLIISRARRYGFRRHQWPDIQQELILDVLAFRYDPAKANGATELTALTTLIDRRLIDILRAATRERKHIARRNAALSIPENPTEDDPAFAYEDDTALRLDVREAITRLTPRQRAVCDALAEGRSVRGTARQIGCDPKTVRRDIKAIRRVFAGMGLGGWVGS